MPKGQFKSIEKLHKAYPMEMWVYFRIEGEGESGLYIPAEPVYGRAKVMGYTYSMKSHRPLLIVHRAFGMAFYCEVEDLISKDEYDAHVETERSPF